MSFRARKIQPSAGFAGEGFLLRPLVPSDVALDYDAVMSSREFLFHWEQDPPYPAEDFSIEDNLHDLEKMDRRHRDGSRYTYTVINTEETQVLGCVYFLPNDDPFYRSAKVTSHDGTDLSDADALISFWVRPATWESGFERTLLDAVLGWLQRDWALQRPVIITNEHLDHQIATIESLGLTQCFDYRRDNDLYTSHAYSAA